MSLLELRRLSKRRRSGGRQVTVLNDASLAIDAGEVVAVWGLRGSGRTTLLRVAAGIDAPDTGSVWFEGRDVAEYGEEILGRDIGYCQKSFRTARGQTCLEEIVIGMLVGGAAAAHARERAHEVLERVGGSGLRARRIGDLDSCERTRLALAHALALRPRLLIIDEPVAGVDLRERDEILALLRSIADEGVAVLMTVGDLTGLTGADQSLTIGDGELRGSGKRQLEPVVDLRLRRQAGA